MVLTLIVKSYEEIIAKQLAELITGITRKLRLSSE